MRGKQQELNLVQHNKEGSKGWMAPFLIGCIFDANNIVAPLPIRVLVVTQVSIDESGEFARNISVKIIQNQQKHQRRRRNKDLLRITQLPEWL